MNTKVAEILEKLKNSGKDQKYLEVFLEDLQNEAENRFYRLMESYMGEEEEKEIEQEENYEKAQEKVKEIFQRKSGKKAEEVMDELLGNMIEEFYLNYESKYKEKEEGAGA